MERIKELWNKIGIQFVKFGFVGVSNTVVSLITYYIFVYFGINYLVANFFGFIIGTLNAYFWNKHFVFKKQTESKESGPTELVKTFITYGMSFGLSTLLLYIQVDLIGISDRIAPVINVMITTPMNFVLNKFWIFAGKRDKRRKK